MSTLTDVDPPFAHARTCLHIETVSVLNLKSEAKVRCWAVGLQLLALQGALATSQYASEQQEGHRIGTTALGLCR